MAHAAVGPQEFFFGAADAALVAPWVVATLDRASTSIRVRGVHQVARLSSRRREGQHVKVQGVGCERLQLEPPGLHPALLRTTARVVTVFSKPEIEP